MARERKRAGLSIPAAAKSIGAGTRTIWRIASGEGAHLFTRDGGAQMRIMPADMGKLAQIVAARRLEAQGNIARARARAYTRADRSEAARRGAAQGWVTRRANEVNKNCAKHCHNIVQCGIDCRADTSRLPMNIMA